MRETVPIHPIEMNTFPVPIRGKIRLTYVMKLLLLTIMCINGFALGQNENAAKVAHPETGEIDEILNSNISSGIVAQRIKLKLDEYKNDSEKARFLLLASTSGIFEQSGCELDDIKKIFAGFSGKKTLQQYSVNIGKPALVDGLGAALEDIAKIRFEQHNVILTFHFDQRGRCVAVKSSSISGS